MADQVTMQAMVVTQDTINEEQAVEKLALFDSSGDPIATDDLVLASVTGADVPLTGYTSGAAEAVVATDTVNEAIAKVEAQAAVDPTGADVKLTGLAAGTNTAPLATNTVNEAVANLQAEVAATRVGSAVILTGYVAGVADDVAATDSVNAAIAKLEARIAALETP